MIRIGHGYDVHAFAEGRKLILCGCEIPYQKGLMGHSDADVALHAICDALLGAAAKGDIGRLYPDTDKKYEGISSLLLLGDVVRILSSDGYSVVNLDCTIIAQEPKLMPYIDAMTTNVASALGTDKENVNIKATTEEHLGFTGRREGISAHAVCLIEK